MMTIPTYEYDSSSVRVLMMCNNGSHKLNDSLSTTCATLQKETDMTDSHNASSSFDGIVSNASITGRGDDGDEEVSSHNGTAQESLEEDYTRSMSLNAKLRNLHFDGSHQSILNAIPISPDVSRWGHESLVGPTTSTRTTLFTTTKPRTRSLSEIMKLNSNTARQMLLQEMSRSDADLTSFVQFEFKRKATSLRNAAGLTCSYRKPKTKLSANMITLLFKDLSESRPVKRFRTI